MEPITYEKIDHMYQATWNQQTVHAKNQAASQMSGAQLNFSLLDCWATAISSMQFPFPLYGLRSLKYEKPWFLNHVF